MKENISLRNLKSVKQYMKMTLRNITIYTILVFISVILITGCAKRISSTISRNDNKVLNIDSPKLAIISLNFVNIDGNYSVSITNSIIINTSKMVSNPKPSKWNENDFVCFILDENRNTLDTLIIIQPLHPRYEYPNDDGRTINSVTIELEDNEVMLRFSYTTKMKYLQIEKVEKNGKHKAIETLLISI